MADTSDRGPLRAISPYERIKQAILDGTFQPGFALVELSVAEWCGVSRTPFREALLRLEQDGLVNKSDCCYPTEKGQRLMADLLYATGFKPLDPPTGRVP